MEHSHSETFSNEEAVQELEEVQQHYTAEYVKELQESLNWHAAILTVLLAEAGGVVEVEAKDLEGIQLEKAKAQVSYDEERNAYIIEGLYTEDES